MKIDFGTKLHQSTLKRLLDRFNVSKRAMTEHYPRFRAAEEQFTAYLPASEAEKLQKERTLKAFSVKIPYAMALAQTYTTYASTVFLGRSPVFQMAATSSGSRSNELAVEAVLNYQVSNNGCRPHLYSWIADPALYGFSTMAVYWDKEVARSGQWVSREKTIFGIPTGSAEKVFEEKELTIYAGNRWETISPYCVFPDPRVPLVDYQKGEFFGVLSYPGWHVLAARADIYHNLDEARKTVNDESARDETSAALKMPSLNEEFGRNSVDTGNKEVLRISVNLIPSEWDLGESSRPQKWIFEVVNRKVIVFAEPLGEMHSMHPFVVQTYEIDSKSFMPRGMMDLLRDSSGILNWLFDSHIYNVRKAINNMFIVDPLRININDLLNGDGGRLIRVNPGFQGMDISQGVRQLQVHDVTQTHLQDIKVVLDLMHKITGVNDNMLGQLYQGRKSATEVRTAASSGANRIQTLCAWQSAVGWEKLSRILLSNTQQFMDEEQRIRIAGGIMSQDDLVVRPEDIVGLYNFIPVDGTLPIDRTALQQVWQGFLREAMQVPQFAQKYDIVKIMAYLANVGGINNLKSFELDPMSGDALAAQAQAGNMVPVQQAMPNMAAAGMDLSTMLKGGGNGL